MTTPSVVSETGISISIFVPLAQGNSSIGDYSAEVNSYSHTISVQGGYLSAELSISGSNNFAENWLQYGLGRHIIVHGPSMQVIWEGFVNQINIAVGGITFSRGPLINLCNRVSAVYTPIIDYDLETGEPIAGSTMETTIVEDEDSQSRYGIWEKILNIGTVEKEWAEYIRDLYLAENASPEGFPSIALSGSSGELTVQLSCRGYIDWINNYVYNYIGTPGISVWASDKIESILSADPNDIISTEYDGIDFNGVLVSSFEEENKLAKVIIDDIVNLGGGSDDRWMFGIYANRKAVYQAIPTTVEYLYHKTDRIQQVEKIKGQILKPWDVQPGKWVAVPDYLTGSSIKVSQPHDDPRVFFGEEVTYTAPDEVSISGAKIRRLAQYMAKLGLGGL